MGKENKESKNEKKGYSLWENTKYMMSILVKYDKVLLFLLFFGAITMTSMWYLWTFILRYVIGIIESSTGDRSQDIHMLIQMGIVLFFLQATLMACNVVSESYLSYHMTYVRLRMNQDRITKTLKMDYEKLETPSILDLMKKAEKSLEKGWVGIEGMLKRMQAFLQMTLCLLLGMAILVTLNPIVILAAVLLGIAESFFYQKTVKLEKELTWDQMGPVMRKQNYLNDVAGNFAYGKDIRLFSMKEQLMDKQRMVNQEQLDLTVRAKDAWIRNEGIRRVIQFILGAILYGFVVKAVLYDGMSIANFSFYIASTYSFTRNLTNMFNSFSKFQSCSEQVNDYRAFMELEQEKKETITIPKAQHYEFQFVDVSFVYPETETFVLEHLNLTVKAGERLAVVGLNGAGKTTFIKLLLRIYDVTDGQILMNGYDIRSFDKEEYYALFSPVFQNIEMFAFPICENISMDIPENTDLTKIDEVLIRSGMMDKISGLPNGVHTNLLKVLHDDGIDLSGGEKQKLALARALYKDAPVIILDEPTSAMDAISESQLYHDFDQLISGKTAVYISHRLSSTRFCDAVAMFEKGRLVEYGTHDSLMKKECAYANMYHVQSKYYQQQIDMEQEVV